MDAAERQKLREAFDRLNAAIAAMRDVVDQAVLAMEAFTEPVTAPTPPELEPAQPDPPAPEPLVAAERTCELCGRVGTRRYVETATGWRCSPTATACIGNRPDPITPGVTARCTDCSRVWNLTGRVLRAAIDLHELKHSHIVHVESGAL